MKNDQRAYRDIFPNVTTERKDPWDWLLWLEGEFLKQMFLVIREQNLNVFQAYQWKILSYNTIHGKPPYPEGGKDVILIWISDEGGFIPVEVAARYKCVFKSYWLREESVGNIHPFPLCGSSEVLLTQGEPFEERKTSVFFSGNLSPNRIDFFRSMTGLRNFPPFPLNFYPFRRIYYEAFKKSNLNRKVTFKIPDSKITFTNGFRQGLGGQDFARQLAHTKVALCPEGFRSLETIRTFEAMKMGCVVLCSKLPPNPFYKNSPIIQIGSWWNLSKKLAELLRDPEELAIIHRKTRDWWLEMCSPQSVAAEFTNRLV